MNIVVTPQITPTFTQIGPLCQNSTAPALPATSNNGYYRYLEPGYNKHSHSRYNNLYIYSCCRSVCYYCNNEYCGNYLILPRHLLRSDRFARTQLLQLLPATSTNAITGTWSPATINTATAGTTTYTFTPAAGQCATTATMNIVVTTSITPTFAQIGPLCLNSTAPALPASSTNIPAITGTWSPATINTATTGTTTYTFTPAAGQCAATTTMDIVVTANITPTFTQIGPLCQNSAAPALPVSFNKYPAITGTWSPATISTATAGTTTYTFTPAAGQCATTATMNIVLILRLPLHLLRSDRFARTLLLHRSRTPQTMP